MKRFKTLNIVAEILFPSEKIRKLIKGGVLIRAMEGGGGIGNFFERKIRSGTVYSGHESKCYSKPLQAL